MDFVPKREVIYDDKICSVIDHFVIDFNLQPINDTMNMTPPMSINDTERSHNMGPTTGNDGKPRKRAIIVRFNSERIRDQVFRDRTNLNAYNNEHRDLRIFINEDLTCLIA